MTDERAQTRRPAPISYRPPKGRAAEFHARVAASGLSTNGFITECIFGRSRHRPAELQLLAQLLDQAAQIADHLHELSIAGVADAQAVAAAQDELAEIRTALMSAMGRAP